MGKIWLTFSSTNCLFMLILWLQSHVVFTLVGMVHEGVLFLALLDVRDKIWIKIVYGLQIAKKFAISLAMILIQKCIHGLYTVSIFSDFWVKSLKRNMFTTVFTYCMVNFFLIATPNRENCKDHSTKYL